MTRSLVCFATVALTVHYDRLSQTTVHDHPLCVYASSLCLS
jgi:hypothetical protein